MTSIELRSPDEHERQPSALVGRDAEIQVIDGFLARIAAGPAALVFEGAPGIGKTTAWASARDRARSGAVHLLSCRPVDAEAKLAFASLADLLEPVAGRALPLLAEPQRVALEVALLRASPRGALPSPRGVAAADPPSPPTRAEAACSASMRKTLRDVSTSGDPPIGRA